MEFITELWLPILVSAVFVFLASSVIHMMIPIHKNDYSQLPGETEVRAALRAQNVPPGNYVFPHCTSMKDMGSDEMMAKYNEGPVGFVTFYPNGPMAIGKSLLQWFVFCLVAGVFIAYVADLAIAPGTDYREVFRLTGTVAFLAYGLGAVLESVWKGVKWSTSFKFVFDGLVYALVTAGAFGWLWPAAA